MEEDSQSLVAMSVDLAKSGTKSLEDAFEILYGQPSYYMLSLVGDHPEHIQKWISIYEKIRADPDAEIPDADVKSFLKGYRTAAGHPLCTLYKRVLKLYPDIKIILVVRNPRLWLGSIRATVLPRNGTREPETFFDCLAERISLGRDFFKMSTLAVRCALGFDCFVNDDERLMKAYQNWIEDVKRTVPKEQLLVLNMAEGWAPLCKFLEVPVPKRPFPHSFEKDVFIERYKSVLQLSRTLRLFAYGVVGLLMGLFGYFALKGCFSYSR
ncbi:unnamed protein product [Calicophoron daubneyi]|uniref:Sulfotransferase n=1 Tax=Calicophoron daubneyi TaxID=300641 RepID=A0AAV2TZF0_CALDB